METVITMICQFFRAGFSGSLQVLSGIGKFNKITINKIIIISYEILLRNSLVLLKIGGFVRSAR